MALSETTRPYEVLFRFHADGTVAAHAQHIRTIKDGGEIIAEKPGDATPLALAGQEFDAAKAAVDAALLAERDALAAELATVKAERDALLAAYSDVG